jgi:hypothetical protein
MPVNTNQLFPLPIDNNVALPNLSFAQFLSHYGGHVSSPRGAPSFSSLPPRRAESGKEVRRARLSDAW